MNYFTPKSLPSSISQSSNKALMQIKEREREFPKFKTNIIHKLGHYTIIKTRIVKYCNLNAIHIYVCSVRLDILMALAVRPIRDSILSELALSVFGSNSHAMDIDLCETTLFLLLLGCEGECPPPQFFPESSSVRRVNLELHHHLATQRPSQYLTATFDRAPSWAPAIKNQKFYLRLWRRVWALSPLKSHFYRCRGLKSMNKNSP